MRRSLSSSPQIHPEEISKEAIFHSFVMVRTKVLSLAEKFTFTVITRANQIIITEEEHPQNQFNYTVNCVKYYFHGKKIILSQGNWIKALLNQKNKIDLENYGVLPFSQMQISKDLQFFMYLQNDKLIPLEAKYVTEHDALIFEIAQQIAQIDHFRSLNECFSSVKPSTSTKIFHFTSEYGILSDIHFVNCFVEGEMPISSYYFISKHNTFIPVIHHKLEQILKDIYSSPAL